LLAAAREDGSVRIWDPRGDGVDRTFEGHSGWATGICVVTLGGREMAASASEDGTVRLWEPDTGQLDLILGGDRTGPVAALGGVPASAAASAVDLVAGTAEDGSVRLWDAATGDLVRTVSGHYGPVLDTCMVTVDGRALLASAGQDGKVRLHDPATGDLVQ